jgi:hypothetical protein
MCARAVEPALGVRGGRATASGHDFPRNQRVGVWLSGITEAGNHHLRGRRARAGNPRCVTWVTCNASASSD